MEYSALERLWFGDTQKDARERAAKSLAAAVGLVKRLKPFPAAAQRLLSLTQSSESSAHEIEEAIGADAGLTVRVLENINSAAFGLRVKCASVSHAVILLGFKEMQQLAAGLAVLDTYADDSREGEWLRDHAVLVAAVSQRISLQRSYLRGSPAYTCGLLHDLGKLMLLQVEDRKYRGLLRRARGANETHTIELAERGYDHAVLAGYLLEQWQVPEPVPTVVALHHQPAAAYAESELVRGLVGAVRLADRMAWDYGDDRFADASDSDMVDRYLADEGAAMIGLARSDIEEIWSEMPAIAGDEPQ